MSYRRLRHFLACWRSRHPKLGAGERQQPKVIMVDAVPARRTGTAIARSVEIIDPLLKAARDACYAHAFLKL